MARTSTGSQQALSAEHVLAGAEGALAAAGHEVSDPLVREIAAQVARGDMAGDDAIDAILERRRSAR